MGDIFGGRIDLGGDSVNDQRPGVQIKQGQQEFRRDGMGEMGLGFDCTRLRF